MELVIGGFAAVGAGTFSNPLEVIKIRMQLQGELLARGKYVRHYKNVFHGAYTIAKNDGILALQKGLVPALWYQFVMNGTRLGTYNLMEKEGFTRNSNGGINRVGSAVCGVTAGVLGAVVGSPFYLVKTRLQAQANASIAVGHQHDYSGLCQGFRQIIKAHGILGLWRGCSTAIMRVSVGSGVQMLTFEQSLDIVRSYKIFPKDSWMTAFCASLMSGIFVAFFMSPFDLIATRYYNQGIDANGKGLLYKSVLECPRKILKEEGLFGFFKGWTANYFRIGPHTLILMVFWDRLKLYYKSYEEQKSDNVEANMKLELATKKHQLD